MIEAIAKLGEIVLSSKSKLESMLDTPLDSKTHIMKINFNTKLESLEIDVTEEIDIDSPFKYRLVGHIGGAGKRQFRLSSKYLEKHMGETLDALSKEDIGEELNNKVKEVLDKFFTTTSEGTKLHGNKFLDLHKLGYSDESIEDIYNRVTDNGSKEITAKTMREELQRIFIEKINNKYGIDSEGIVGIYVIDIDDMRVYTNSDYENILVSNDEDSQEEGICNVCGMEKELVKEVSFNIKTFTTNQVIFNEGARGSSKGENFKVCKDCISSIRAGENYLNQKLNTRIYGISTYIIPNFIYGEKLNIEELNYVADKLKDAHNKLEKLKVTGEIVNEISMDLDGIGYFNVNYMMHSVSNSATKIRDTITEIQPTRYSELEKIIIKANDMIKELDCGSFNLNTIYYMYPILDNKKDPDFREILTIYKSIMKKNKLNRRVTINNILKCIRYIAHCNEGFAVGKRFNNRLENYVLLSNAYVRFLELNDNLEVGNSMDGNAAGNKLGVDKVVTEYAKDMGLNEQQYSMFILGNIIGNIGTAQYTQRGSKPILKRVNYSGMGEEKILRLFNEVLEAVHNEKMGVYTELMFEEASSIFMKNRSDWKLSKEEAVYYILSGYALSTKKAILNGGNKDERDNK